METLFGWIVLAFFTYGAYKVWYVPRETMKKSAGFRLADVAEQAKK